MVYSLGYLLCKNEHHKFSTSSIHATHDCNIKDRNLLCTERLNHIKARPKEVSVNVDYLADWILLARQERAGL